jgi:hypothetical protein
MIGNGSESICKLCVAQFNVVLLVQLEGRICKIIVNFAI